MPETFWIRGMTLICLWIARCKPDTDASPRYSRHQRVWIPAAGGGNTSLRQDQSLHSPPPGANGGGGEPVNKKLLSSEKNEQHRLRHQHQ